MAAKKGGLGRGLDALFADAVPVTNPEPEIKETKAKTSKKKQAEEAFRRFIEIHGSDFVTDERIKEQNAIAETTSKALLELSMAFFSVQSEVKGLERQIEELKKANEGPEEPHEEPIDEV